MEYRFCFGASGAGKSTKLHEWIIRQAGEALHQGNLDKAFLVIVPDQYTMQTQKDLVLAAGERGGILNADVLSFGRLSHRVFEEVGADPRGVLDDMGKTLLLRRLTARLGDRLQVLGSGADRPGMAAEIKSVISEFMQYGICAAEVGDLAACAAKAGQGGLAARLTDLELLYQAFLEDRKERYLTGEETLDLLAEAVPRSRLLAGSTVVFDGFTGFTPVQNRVIAAIMQAAEETVFALDYAPDGGTDIREVLAGAPFEEQDLFYLTRKTAAQITHMAQRAGIAHGRDMFLTKTPRFDGEPALQHLEKALFRYPVRSYAEGEGAALDRGPADGTPEQMRGTRRELPVHLSAASSPEEEVRQTFLQIRHLIEEKGYHYRDIAIVTGDLAGYEDALRTAAQRYDTPVYLDTNRAILQNPLTETIRGALEIGAGDYSYETVFRFLRCGLVGISAEMTDRLENYCLRRGIASRKRWETVFDPEFEEARKTFLAAIAPLQDQGRATAKERTENLYRFLLGIHAGSQMQQLAEDYEAAGEPAPAMEYRQIYGAVLELLDQIHELLGDELTPAGEFQELMEAGFAEIRLGTLPQQVDRILIGDIERTRLSQVKVLFFLGVNDGSVPGNSSKGGLISDLDREFLKETSLFKTGGLELAPTPREQMYTQRLYLYMNLTKPTCELYVSYSKCDAAGASLRPSYLIGLLQQMFPTLSVQLPEERSAAWQVASHRDAGKYLAAAIRSYADGRYLRDENAQREFLTMYGVMYAAGCEAQMLREAAFSHYRPKPLSKKTAQKLYHGLIRGSVTRLETAAACYLRQYLYYGLRLREREEYTFKENDSGTILHESIRMFGQLLREEGLSWLDYTKEQGGALMAHALQNAAGDYKEQVLYATQRSAYQLGRLQKILEKTAEVLQYQLQQGDFLPEALERAFGYRGEITYPLEDGTLVLEGRIDRVDLAREDGRIYVKIVDYKSGKKELNPARIRAGLQLQLPLYLEVQRRSLLSRNPEQQIVPAAMLYSRFDNPVLSARESAAVMKLYRAGDTAAADQESRRLLRKKLRPDGAVGAEEDILEHLDHALSGDGVTSEVVPAARKKDGTLRAESHVFTAEGYGQMVQQLEEKICQLAEDILKGRTDARPVRYDGNTTACTYCPYQDSCGFDRRIPGYDYRGMDEPQYTPGE